MPAFGRPVAMVIFLDCVWVGVGVGVCVCVCVSYFLTRRWEPGHVQGLGARRTGRSARLPRAGAARLAKGRARDTLPPPALRGRCSVLGVGSTGSCWACRRQGHAVLQTRWESFAQLADRAVCSLWRGPGLRRRTEKGLYGPLRASQAASNELT